MTNILFSLTLRLYLARLAIIFSLLLVTVNVEWSLPLAQTSDVIFFLLYILILLHHTTAMASLRFVYGIIDLLLLIVEIVGVIFSGQGLFPIQSWFPETFVLHIVLIWGTFGCLAGLLILRIATIVRSRGGTLITLFDIQAHTDQPKATKETENSFINLLMGRSIWKVHFVGEQKPLRTFRGFWGLIFLFTLSFWVLLKVFFEPMKETALSPVREYRATIPPLDFIEKIQNPMWNIRFPVPVNSEGSGPSISADRFFESVRVETLWNPIYYENYTLPNCTTKTPPLDRLNGVYSYGFLCQKATLPDSQTGDESWFLPDLLISVNFTNLNPSAPMSNPTSQQKLVHIVVGLTNATDIVQKTVPFPLFQGVNVASSIITGLRQVYSKPALAALGIFQTTTLYWDARIVATYTDPDVDSDPDFSTLRIYWQDNFAETYIVQDYRESSVIAGFASVGGLWTTLSGVFAILFGASMLQILYGSKPLSIFGLAHSFNYRHMKAETLRQYPNIIKEHEVGPHRGLLALLRDHLIGLKFLDEESDSNEGAIPPKTDEEHQASSEKEQQHILETDSVPSIRPRLILKPSNVPSMSSGEGDGFEYGHFPGKGLRR